MRKEQHCAGRPEAPRRARGPLVLRPVVPLLTRLLVVAVVGGVLALLLAFSLTTGPAAPVAAIAAPAAVAELPRVVVSGRRLAAPTRSGPPGTTSKDL